MWLCNDSEFTTNNIDNYIGFVYLITNLLNGKKYIGKKNFFAKKTVRYKPSKKTGKTKKTKRSLVESDWQSYYGSNTDLQKDVELLGPKNFKREILRLCKSKGEMSYFETKEQFDKEALFRDDYYNTFIGCRIHRKHVKF